MARYVNVGCISSVIILLLSVTNTNPAILNNPQAFFYPRSSESLDCNASITLDDSLSSTGDFVKTWSSPNFPQNYADDISCTLNITFAESLGSAVMWVSADSRSSISPSMRCQYDYLQYTSKDGYKKTFCDRLEDISITELLFDEESKSAQWKFMSSSLDESTDVGFELTIRALKIN
ncbi:unnamed protein product [Meganyctiphanes norvegica]|uniref:CUB domain-containing protein n=1 Tax=Meganyctiphanes norvegica TaxID=48144 RepID=A0AAV2RQV0_MEGNR